MTGTADTTATTARAAMAATMVGTAIAALAGCQDLSRFSTRSDEAYCGSIVDVEGNLVRRGFEATRKLRMTLDVSKVDTSPGTLTTDDRFLDAAPMVRIPELINDPLWSLDFGEGRDKNLVFIVYPSQPTGGPSILTVLSLLHDGDAEVRLIRGAAPLEGVTTAVAGEVPLFGVFGPMHRQTGECVY